MAKKKKKKVYKKKRIKSKKNSKRRKKRKLLYLTNFFLSLLISSILFFLIMSFFFSIKTVNGNSMKSEFTNGQKVIIKKREAKLKRFDVIAFKDVKKTEFRRIIGLPGDTIKYVDDDLFINEELVTEKFIIDQINQASVEGKIYTQSTAGNSVFRVDEIPENYYFVLGDNRDYAIDSRHYGLVSKERIKGIVMQ